MSTVTAVTNETSPPPLVCYWSWVRANLPDNLLPAFKSIVMDYVKPTVFPTIEEVAESLTGLDIDNDSRKRYITINYLRKYKHVTDAVPDDDVRAILHSELVEFVAIMNERNLREFWCTPVIFDVKHGHSFVTQWIMQRWFVKCKRLEDLPEWYRRCIDLSQSPCSGEYDLCTKMIASLADP
jgi:hypothetical protein